MHTKRTIYPGQHGTQKWIKKYGPDLICVRYKYDEKNKRKMITVELVAEETAWTQNNHHVPNNKIMSVRINYGEVELGKQARMLGGTWNKNEKVWKLSWRAVQILGLESRVIQ